ncbi:MAG TPA: hypothetical protein VFZ70_15160 [Euzebyales bacterium]
MAARRYWIVIAVIAAAVLGALAVSVLRDPAPETRRAAGASEEPFVAPQPAALRRSVTRVAHDPTAPEPLSIVSRSHTAVVSAAHTDRLVAAQVALALGAPLVVVPARGPGDGASASEPTAEPASDGAVADLQRLGVVRAVTVSRDDDVDAVLQRAARDGGARDVVRLRPTGGSPPTERTVLRDAVRGDSDGDPAVDPAALRDLEATGPPTAEPTGTAVITRPRGASALQLAVAARAVGHTVITTVASDLRGDRVAIRQLAEMTDGPAPEVIVGTGTLARQSRQNLALQVAVASTGMQLPGGGQLVIDPRRPHARRYITLYGVPQSPALGVLGEQSVDESVVRAREMRRRYRRAVDDGVEVVGGFEIIATVASSSAGRDGNFANELRVAELEPSVRAARRAGLYVLLDIQPGRSDFLTLARRYRKLLRQPHVGLALDPEWRLAPGERHLEQIGSVGIDEVNAVADWLAELTRRNRLPQKMLLLHQFRLSMIRERAGLDTSHPELAYVVQMDGQGPQHTKLETWAAVTANAPTRVQFGWKNFYDEDTPLRSPEATMALEPPPVFVSYQ